jgi:hypothetical protein
VRSASSPTPAGRAGARRGSADVVLLARELLRDPTGRCTPRRRSATTSPGRCSTSAPLPV